MKSVTHTELTALVQRLSKEKVPGTVNSILGDEEKMPVRTCSICHRRADEGDSNRNVKPTVLHNFSESLMNGERQKQQFWQSQQLSRHASPLIALARRH